MVERLFSGRPPTQSHDVLDPGCGTGVFLQGIVRWCRGNRRKIPHLLGIESDPERARIARTSLANQPAIEIRQQDFLTNPVDKFDFVIGNPPYVPITSLSESEKRQFRHTYETARGRFDLYLLFFERALKSLKPDGRLVFITPEKFLYVETAAPLRRLLSTFQIENIKLADEQVFQGLTTYPTITSVVNCRPNRPTTIMRRDGKLIETVLSGDGRSWMPRIWEDESRQPHLTLQDVCARVSCGVATGADSVFVRPTSQLHPGLMPFAYPTLAGRELTEPGALATAMYSMLIPYTEDGRLLEEEALGPLGNYLRKREVREHLMRRTCVARKPWYAFHETPPLREILRPKILCKDITQQPFFWIDRAGAVVPRHSVYYIVPKCAALLEPLSVYLNSETAVAWLRSHCQRAANGFLRVQSSILKSLPVPFDIGSTLNGLRKPRSARRGTYPELPGLVTLEHTR
jgi:adenine-specific DNA-methyltransferase